MRNDAKWRAIVADYRSAPLTDRERALVRYAEKLTRAPREMESADVDALRAAGLADAEILDACQITGYYNFVNRLAHGLGVELEEYWGAEGAGEAGAV